MIDLLAVEATNTCFCKNPIKVKFKEPREFHGILLFSTKVPCGKCELCLKRRQREWFVRCYEEWKHAQTAFFVTLTYDDKNIPIKDGVPVVSKKDCQDFFKRLRKPLLESDEYKDIHISYLLVSEYGDQFHRPHYHMLLFNYPLSDIESVRKSIEEAWQNGLVSVGTVTSASINYCTKYCLKNENKKETTIVPCFMLSSRRPAIGAAFLSKQAQDFYKGSRKQTTNIQGVNYPLPKYYKNKLFTDSERADMYSESLESVYDDLSLLLERVDSLSEIHKLKKEQINAKCNEIKRKQELASMRGNQSLRNKQTNQKPNSKTL